MERLNNRCILYGLVDRKIDCQMDRLIVVLMFRLLDGKIGCQIDERLLERQRDCQIDREIVNKIYRLSDRQIVCQMNKWIIILINRFLYRQTDGQINEFVYNCEH